MSIKLIVAYGRGFPPRCSGLSQTATGAAGDAFFAGSSDATGDTGGVGECCAARAAGGLSSPGFASVEAGCLASPVRRFVDTGGGDVPLFDPAIVSLRCSFAANIDKESSGHQCHAAPESANTTASEMPQGHRRCAGLRHIGRILPAAATIFSGSIRPASNVTARRSSSRSRSAIAWRIRGESASRDRTSSICSSVHCSDGASAISRRISSSLIRSANRTNAEACSQPEIVGCVERGEAHRAWRAVVLGGPRSATHSTHPTLRRTACANSRLRRRPRPTPIRRPDIRTSASSIA